jgi:hypothetical protein
MCRHLPGHLFGQRPEAGEWCISEVLCHMRDVDVEVNLPRLRTVLGVENPFIPGVDTDPWAEERNYIQQDGARALQNFMVARGHLVNFLESIEPGDWNRPSRHAIFGPTHFYELVGIIAAHDRLHIRQVRKVLDSISGIH